MGWLRFLGFVQALPGFAEHAGTCLPRKAEKSHFIYWPVMAICLQEGLKLSGLVFPLVLKIHLVILVTYAFPDNSFPIGSCLPT